MKRLRILFFVFVTVLVAAPFSHGAAISLQDDQIYFDLPAGWEDFGPGEHDELIQEYDPAAPEELKDGQGDAAELLLLKYKEFAGVPATVELLYSNDDDGQFNYEECGKKDLENYFDNYGYEFIESILPETGRSREISRGGQIFFEGWSTFLQANAKEETETGEAIQYQVYYTVKDGCVISILLTCYGDKVPVQAEKEAQQMVAGFSDSGYYQFYAGGGFEEEGLEGNLDDWDSWDTMDSAESEGRGGILLFLALGPLIAMIILFSKSETYKNRAVRSRIKMETPKRAASEALSQPAKARTQPPKPILQPAKARTAPAQARTEPSKPEKQHPKFDSLKADGRILQVRSRQTTRPHSAKTPDESYLKGLKTLLDSGLLTKEQYREMVEKHQRERR